MIDKAQKIQNKLKLILHIFFITCYIFRIVLFSLPLFFVLAQYQVFRALLFLVLIYFSLLFSVLHCTVFGLCFSVLNNSLVQLPAETDYLLITFVAFHLIAHLFMSILNCMADSKAEKM